MNVPETVQSQVGSDFYPGIKIPVSTAVINSFPLFLNQFGASENIDKYKLPYRRSIQNITSQGGPKPLSGRMFRH